MPPKTPHLFLIAGEASGDRIGAELMASLKQKGKVRFSGIGGPLMEAQGMESLFPMEELSLMGFYSIFRALPNLRRRFNQTIDVIQKQGPDVVITIDAPEFSFRVMKYLHTLPHRPRLIHYVAPSVWAWRPGRAKKISLFLDHLLCLFPFEPPLFQKWGLPATFIGHPVATQENREEGGRDPSLLCVLPGSRRSEVEKLLPVFGQTVALLQKTHPELKVVIPTLPHVETLVREGIKDWPLLPQIVVGNQEKNKVFRTAYVALAASGTVTLELAAAHLPFVVAYKIGPLNAWVMRRLIKTPWVCMINILLNRTNIPKHPTTYIPEYIQQDCTPEKLAAGLEPLMKSQAVRENQERAMAEAIGLLKAPSADVPTRIIRESYKANF